MQRLLVHQWKEPTRSPYFQKSLLANLFLGFIGLYFIVCFLFIGFYADKIIIEIYKEGDLIEIFSRLLFYYFAFDLIMRFLFQQLPTLSIQPYLTLPIKKSKLLHYILIKSLPGFFNFIPFLLFIPFFFKIVCTNSSLIFSLTWAVTVISLVLMNNYLNFSLKKYFSKRPFLMLALLLSIALIIYLEITKKTSLSGILFSAIDLFSGTPLLIVTPIVAALTAYYIAFALLNRNSYIEDISTTQRTKTKSFLFLNRYGEVGVLIANELKMILRNKRPRSMLIVSAIFLLYGFIFYKENHLNNYLMLTFTGTFITAILSINYGQFIFSWESSFFDSYIVNKISPYNIIKSKYLFFAFLNIFCYIITLPYMLISPKIGLINTAIFLYNTGISSIVVLLFGVYNSKRIDLGKSQFMNYEGTGVSQFFMVFPILGFPIIIYVIFKLFGIPQYNFYALGIIGIIGILFSKYMLQYTTSLFVKRKYKMAFNFRQK